jgi:O-acetyl-ADP-ribose deacetylase (regulator of RNase III)
VKNRFISAGKLAVAMGDITAVDADAIVNAANNSLLGGGGVDGAIHNAAGPQLIEECRSIGGCPTGEARITKGYALSCRWVIHTVGPIWNGGGNEEDELLARCYRSCFELAETYEIRSMAFPSISTGAYGFPAERASRIAVGEMSSFLGRNSSVKITVACFTRKVYDCYMDALKG